MMPPNVEMSPRLRQTARPCTRGSSPQHTGHKKYEVDQPLQVLDALFSLNCFWYLSPLCWVGICDTKYHSSKTKSPSHRQES